MAAQPCAEPQKLTAAVETGPPMATLAFPFQPAASDPNPARKQTSDTIIQRKRITILTSRSLAAKLPPIGTRKSYLSVLPDAVLFFCAARSSPLLRFLLSIFPAAFPNQSSGIGNEGLIAA
jgi:hypothetical protein